LSRSILADDGGAFGFVAEIHGAQFLQMMAAHSDLLRKFTGLAFDEAAEARWQESRPGEADNIDVGPATETDLQSDLIEASGNPF